jgi:hypothetical protein
LDDLALQSNRKNRRSLNRWKRCLKELGGAELILCSLPADAGKSVPACLQFPPTLTSVRFKMAILPPAVLSPGWGHTHPHQFEQTSHGPVIPGQQANVVPSTESLTAG